MLARRGVLEEDLEGERGLADQHVEPVDGLQPTRFGGLEQRSLERRIDDVIDERVVGKRRQIEVERRVPGHAQRAGVDQQRGGRQRRIERLDRAL